MADLETGAYIVIALRLLVPLLILRWQLAGGIAAMLLDGADVILIDIMGLGGFGGHYHQTDKLLDTYYLAIECAVAWRWLNPWARWPALALFGFRTVGVAAFEVTEERITLFIFPNMFENWWLYCVAVARFWPRLEPKSVKSVAIPMVILLVPKMGQEWLLHYTEAKPWTWFKENVFDIS